MNVKQLRKWLERLELEGLGDRAVCVGETDVINVKKVYISYDELEEKFDSDIAEDVFYEALDGVTGEPALSHINLECKDWSMFDEHGVLVTEDE